MYDTKQTDYRITAPDVPFRADPKADVVKAVFDAFRAQGFGTGAYFSKPDWHHPDFWAPEWATPDRNVNYSIERVPRALAALPRLHLPADRGARHRLRAARHPLARRRLGPARARWSEIAPGHFVKNAKNMDIDMPRIAAMARRHQPGLLVVDRTVAGRYENYRTPEQEIPEKPLPYAWETCMTMGGSWSYNPERPLQADPSARPSPRRHRLQGRQFPAQHRPEPRGRVRARGPRPAPRRSASG